MPEIYCCPLPEVDAALLASYGAVLSDDERQRQLRFTREPAARTFVVGRALLRTVLAERLGCTPQSLRFTRDANDKPQLAFLVTEGHSTLQFNLSHSNDWIVLAVSEVGAVGIDIETSLRGTDILGIARRYFPRAEFELLSALPQPQRAPTFCELWTIKEACVKWSGLGIGRALAGVGVQIDNGVIALDLRADIATPGPAPQALLYAPAATLRLAVVGTFAGTSAPQKTMRQNPTLQKYVPLLGAEKLDLTPIARTVAV